MPVSLQVRGATYRPRPVSRAVPRLCRRRRAGLHRSHPHPSPASSLGKPVSPAPRAHPQFRHLCSRFALGGATIPEGSTLPSCGSLLSSPGRAKAWETTCESQKGQQGEAGARGGEGSASAITDPPSCCPWRLEPLPLLEDQVLGISTQSCCLLHQKQPCECGAGKSLLNGGPSLWPRAQVGVTCFLPGQGPAVASGARGQVAHPRHQGAWLAPSPLPPQPHPLLEEGPAREVVPGVGTAA